MAEKNAGSKSKVQFWEEGWSLKTTQNEINHVLLILFYNNCGFPLSSYLISVPFMMELLVSIGVGLEGVRIQDSFVIDQLVPFMLGLS